MAFIETDQHTIYLRTTIVYNLCSLSYLNECIILQISSHPHKLLCLDGLRSLGHGAFDNFSDLDVISGWLLELVLHLFDFSLHVGVALQ